MDPGKNAGTLKRDERFPLEFGGNTPSGGKFSERWYWHGWMADPQHRGDSHFKRKKHSVVDAEYDAASEKEKLRQLRSQKDAEYDEEDGDDDDDYDDDE